MSAVSPQNMRALMYRGVRKLEVVEHPVSKPGPDDVLLEISHCGICGTDLHTVLEGMSRPDRIGGHEYSGRIAFVGERVEGWAIGDHAVPRPRAGCGECRCCVAGRPSLCPTLWGSTISTGRRTAIIGRFPFW